MNERAIFFQALDRDDPAERAAYLDEACAGDAALRQRIEALLRAHAKAGDFLGVPALQQLAGGEDTPSCPGASLEGETPSAHADGNAPLDFLSPPRRAGSLGHLGHYEVLGIVGRGGMGVVLRAFDEKLHRLVAIKALAPALAAAGVARQRFVREARAAAAVTHDNVIAIHAVEDAGPVPYLVMPLIDGPTVQARLDRIGPLPVEEVLRIGMQTATGLAAAHALGLVHRDIKPANLLLERGVERVKITDFGLARAVDDVHLTQSGVIAGTPAYMSPEQANGDPVDARSDLFSLGSVLYALCAGSPPFRADTTMAVLRQVCEGVPRPLREVNEDVPTWLEALIARLHAKDPAERFQTAAEVADLLGRHLACMPQSDTPEPIAAAPNPPPRGWRARRAALAGLLLLGLALAGGAVARRGLPRPDEAPAPDGANGPASEGPPQAWRPPTSEELAKRPSPLDTLKREGLGLPANAPPELRAVLGQPRRFPLLQRGELRGMAQSGDGRLLAVPNATSILLFEARTGELFKRLDALPVPAHRPTFSPDGRSLLAVVENRHLCIWDVATGIGKTQPFWFGTPPWAVTYDPRGNRIVALETEGRMAAYTKRDHLIVPAASSDATPHAGYDLAFSPGGKRLASVSSDGTCTLWGADTLKEIRTLRGNGKPFEAVAWNRDGKLLAAGGDAEVVVWNADTCEVVHTLNTPGKGLLAFGPDGHTLWTARHDCSQGEQHAFTRWDMATGARLATCPLPSSGSRVAFLLSPDGKTVFVHQDMSDDVRVRAYDAETGQERFPHRGHTAAVRCLAFSPDGRTLASGGSDRAVLLWDLAGWQPGEPAPPFRTLPRMAGPVTALAFNPDGTLLAVEAGGEGTGLTLQLWGPVTGRKVRDLDGTGRNGACDMAFSPDGSVLAVGAEGRVNLWDVQTGRRQEVPCWNDGYVRTVAFSPDGRLLASGDTRTIHVLDRSTGQRLHTFRGERNFVHLAFSPDGRALAATTDGHAPLLRLWDVANGEEQPVRTAGQGQGNTGLAFHPGGRLAATVNALSPHVQIWDVTPSGPVVRTLGLLGNRNAISLAYSPEGRYVAVGLVTGVIVLLRAEP